MTNLGRFLLPLLAGSLLAACGTTIDPQPGEDGEVARSSLARDTSPVVAAETRAKVANGNLAFAQGLYGKLAAGNADNVFFSPVSVSYALAMTGAGARGETATEMSATLGLGLEDAETHAALNAIDLELSARGEGKAGKDGKAFRLRLVNSVWGEKTAHFESPYLDLLATQYGAGIRLVDFVGAADPARVAINGWVESQTEGRIKDLLGPGAVDAATRMVLVNAVYFNGAWETPFLEEATKPAPFHAPSGDVSAPTMHLGAELPYAASGAWKAVALPYQDTRLQLVVMMPVEGTLASLEGTLDAATLSAIGEKLAPAAVQLAMPKFKIDGASISLRPALEALGMHVPFANADFTGISKDGGLSIADVVHRAFVEIDEKGTEAAAATAVVLAGTAAPTETIAFDVDRPFAFFLRDVPTNTVLFAGHVTNPAK